MKKERHSRPVRKMKPVFLVFCEGTLSEKQKQLLWDNRKLASDRAKKLSEGENPSSLIYRLIVAMDGVREKKN